MGTVPNKKIMTVKMSYQAWNDLNLTRPPIVVVSVNKSNIPLSRLREILNEVLQFLKSKHNFKQSAEYCYALVAKRKNSFRRLQGFKQLCKIKTSLGRYFTLNIDEIIQNFLGLLPDFISGEAIELPYQQNFNYLLIRLISLKKVLARISFYCKKTATYFVKVINNGFHIEISILILSVVSRLWKLANSINEKICTYYELLYIFRHYFPKCKSSSLENIILSKICHSDNGNDKSNIVEINENLTTSKTNLNTSIFTKVSKVVDIGEVVQRPLQKQQRELRTLKDIKRFIQKEDEQRKYCIIESKLQNIPNNKWTKFKKEVLIKLKEEDKRGVFKIFQKYGISILQ